MKSTEYPSQSFPSFAASPQLSPQSSSIFLSPSTQQVRKLSIHLPQSMAESTFEEQAYNQGETAKEQSNIRVYCRFRPSVKTPSCIKYDSTMIDDGQNCYSFDSIFGKFSSQEEIYEAVTRRHIDQFFSGRNSTIFAYGQTGSGKTHTMFGDLKEKQEYGIIPRALDDIFTKGQQKSDECKFTCSMLQIYNQKLIDLFHPLPQPQIKLKQVDNCIWLQNLIEVSVETKQQILNLIKIGHKGRKVASTYNNDCSSRSHTILFLYRNYVCQQKEYKCKLCFIDLAGSQKVRKSGVKGQTLEQTKKINLSLSCLGNVVHALTNQSDHIPYRNSKLTRILKDSLSGDTKTSIITTCSLQKQDHHQTISTVKFAVRAKKIRNKKRLNNEQITMEEMVERLKQELAETKKELSWYKQREEGRQIEKLQVDGGGEIPQESVSYQPVRSICVSGGVGLGSRVKMIQTVVSE